jgi:UDP-2-acetamido-2,6-beta-L-arabino-hexul-4-ose reductase
VVATFCYNINRDIPIVINNREVLMNFYYVNDVMDRFIKHLNENLEPDNDSIYRLPENQVYCIMLGELADKLYYFRECQQNSQRPVLQTSIDERLYSTYISYAEENDKHEQ